MSTPPRVFLTGSPDSDSILLLAGNDIIFSLEGDDIIEGNPASNIFNGNIGKDTVRGNDGDDLVRGGKNDDLLFGDSGNDTIYGDLGNDTAFGGDGDDLLFGDRGAEANFSGNGNDFLDGSAGNDSLLGLDGNDILEGNIGDDFLDGNQGDDTVKGGEGNDIVRGGKDRDLLFGEQGNDTLYGDLGADTVNGGQGKDIFVIGRRSDVTGFRTTGGVNIADADFLTDFTRGEDLISLIGGLTFAELHIFNGSDIHTGNTIIQDKVTGEYLAILKGINASEIKGSDFIPPGISPGNIQFSAPTFSINENGTPIAAVTLTRTGGSDGVVSVKVFPNLGTSLGGSSPLSAPKDYDNSFITVYWGDGDTAPKTVSIPIFDDLEFEGNETINLTLSSPTGGAKIGTQDTAVLTIVDNDSLGSPSNPGSLSFTAANYSGNEGNNGTVNKVVATIQRTGGSDGTVSVQVQLDAGSTATPNDYTNNLPIAITFNNGETAKNVEIPIIGDTVFEGNDTINLKLVNPTGGATPIGQQNATYTIINDDAAPTSGSLEFTAAAYSGNEGNSGNPVNAIAAKVKRTGGTNGPVSVQVQLDSSPGSATAPDDYSNNLPITINFADGEGGEKDIIIPIVGDTNLEQNETINLRLINPTGGVTLGGQQTATYAIANDDIATNPEIEVFDGGSNISDGTGTANFGTTTVGKDITKTFTVKNTGGADLKLGTLNLPNGFSLVSGFASDNLLPGQETTFSVKLNSSTIATASGILSFGNNDSNENPFDFTLQGTVNAVPVPEIEVKDTTVNITDGTGTAIDFGNTAIGTPVIKTFTVNNTGSATLNLSDIKLPTGFSLLGNLPNSIEAGNSANFQVQLNANSTGTFQGTLEFTNNDGDEDPFNFPIVGTVNPPNVSISASPTVATETGTAGTFTIARTGDASAALSVNLALDSSSTLTSDSGGTFPIDYNFSVSGGSISGTGTTRTLIIPAGQSSVDLTLTPINDTHAEADETLKLNLATGDYSIDAVKNTGTVTVAANDTEVINLNDSVNDYKLTEGSLRQALLNAITFAGADTITFSGAGASGTINLVDELPNITGSNANNTTIDGPGANILTVQRSANPGTPKFGIFTFTNVTGAIDGLKIANGDRIGGSPTNGGGITNNAGTVTISDSIISNNKAVIAGGIFNYGTMTVRNSTISDNYASSQIGGIANAGNNGDVLTIINSTISGNKAEGRYGGIATANLGTTMNLFNSTIYNNSAGIGQGGVYTNGTAVYAKNTIVAGNIAPSDPDFSGTLTSEGYNLIGNSSGAAITGNTTGNIVGTPGTTINPKLDPLQNNGGSTPTHALQSDSPAINAGDPSFAPPPNTDQRGTGFDRVFGGRIDIGAFESKLTPALPQLSINDVTVTEGNFGSVSAFFTVTLSSKSSSSVSVKYTTADNTAVAGSDYSFSTGTITFAPNETTKTIFVPIQSDTAYETTEKFAVTLSNPTNAEINDGVGEGTIIDNDNFPTITINDITVTPPKTGTVDAVFTVTLSNPSSFPISVDFATANDTATTPEDYVNSSGKLTFDPGQVSKTIPVQVKSPPPPPTPLSSEIRGTSWNDSDKDGVRDLGETGLANRTIFLDKNQNGILNAGEISTTTDANGNYAFTNLMPGGYTVAQLSQVGWTQTFPSNSSPSPSVLIPVSNRRDHVFDPTRNLLYITTSDGKVQRYNVVTKTLLSAFNVGTSLNGADITPDGNFLYVAENQTSGGQGFFRKVNLNNGAVTNIPYTLDFGEAGAWDVEIAANGKGLATTDYSGSGWTPLRELNTATDTLSIRTDVPGSGFNEVNQRTHITRSADRSFFFLTESNISSGPIFTYDPNGEGQEKFNLNLSNATNANILDDRGVGTIKADQFPSKGETNTFHSNALSSLNRDGSLIALESYPSDIVIRDKSLNPVKTLTGYEGGMVFDSKRDILYAANVSTDRIVAFDTNSWNQLYTLNIGENINGDDSFGWNFGSGLMSVSDDGKYLFMSTPSGVRMFDLPQLGSHAVTLGSGQVVNAIDFGSSV